MRIWEQIEFMHGLKFPFQISIILIRRYHGVEYFKCTYACMYLTLITYAVCYKSYQCVLSTLVINIFKETAISPHIIGRMFSIFSQLILRDWRLGRSSTCYSGLCNYVFLTRACKMSSAVLTLSHWLVDKETKKLIKTVLWILVTAPGNITHV